MRVLVTGATGFVGSHLVRALLERGDEVSVFRRPGARTEGIDGLAVEHHLGDLCAPETVDAAIAAARPDAVFHVAGAYSFWGTRHGELYRTNVLGTRAVVAACAARGVRLVRTGSCVGFAGTRGPRVCDESGNDDLSRWRSFHAVSMVLAEREAVAGAARGAFVVQVHPGLVVGEGDLHYHAAWVFVAAQRGGILGRFYWPGGLNLVDIGDVVRAHLLALDRGRSGESYLIGGENLTHSVILAAAESVVGSGGRFRLPIGRLPLRVLGVIGDVVGRLRGDDARNRLALNGTGAELASLYWWFTSGKAERELGWSAGPVRPALEREWAWLSARFAARRVARAAAGGAKVF